MNKASNWHGEERKQYVKQMFNEIADTYDLINHIGSVGTDIMWRRYAARFLKSDQTDHVLDLASGTGDFVCEIYKQYQCQITAADLSINMLSVAETKIRKLFPDARIDFNEEDAENLTYKNDTFSACTLAFGLRNFGNKEVGLNEVYRVLKPGGKFIILEFMRQKKSLLDSCFRFYFKHMIPLIGRLFSGHKEAYNYLPESVSNFYTTNELIEILNQIGFRTIKIKHFFFGIASMFYVEKT